jgi:hypothetical protein
VTAVHNGSVTSLSLGSPAVKTSAPPLVPRRRTVTAAESLGTLLAEAERLASGTGEDVPAGGVPSVRVS